MRSKSALGADTMSGSYTTDSGMLRGNWTATRKT
jgi:hypothetical protein